MNAKIEVDESSLEGAMCVNIRAEGKDKINFIQFQRIEKDKRALKVFYARM